MFMKVPLRSMEMDRSGIRPERISQTASRIMPQLLVTPNRMRASLTRMLPHVCFLRRPASALRRQGGRGDELAAAGRRGPVELESGPVLLPPVEQLQGVRA